MVTLQIKMVDIAKNDVNVLIPLKKENVLQNERLNMPLTMQMCADCEHWKQDNTDDDTDICASYWDYCIHPNAPEDSEIIDIMKSPPDWCPLKKQKEEDSK